MRLFDNFERAPHGLFTLKIYRRGQLIEVFEEKNLIVSNSQQIHAKLLGGAVAGQSVSQIGFGTSLAPAASGNNSLTNPFMKALDSVSYPASNQVSFNFSLLSSEDNGANIGEFGLFTASGTLYARKVRTAAIPKDTDLSFTGSWIINF